MGHSAPSVRVPPGATVPVDRAPENTGAGAGAGTAGVAEFEAVEAALDPTELVATTVNV